MKALYWGKPMCVSLLFCHFISNQEQTEIKVMLQSILKGCNIKETMLKNEEQSQLANWLMLPVGIVMHSYLVRETLFLLKTIKWLCDFGGKMHCRWYFFFFLIKKELFFFCCSILRDWRLRPFTSSNISYCSILKWTSYASSDPRSFPLDRNQHGVLEYMCG